MVCVPWSQILQMSGSGWRVISHCEPYEDFFRDDHCGSIQIFLLEQTVIYQHIGSENRNLLAPIFDLLLIG